MDSDKSDDEEHDAISKQIVDYYRKYSQNKNLPKYFSGTSLSYMPQIVNDDEIVTAPCIVVDEASSETVVGKQADECPGDCEEILEPKAVSPASSVTSNRKLEWDNGADIGYNNCNKSIKLHKSLSLPTLMASGDNKNIERPPKPKLGSQVVTVISYSSPEDASGYRKVQSSSSSSAYSVKPPVESSSSSTRTNVKLMSTTSSSFTSTIAYLKSKLGSPDAESTPKLPSNYVETPVVPKLNKARFKNRIVTLCVTKPILVECFDNKKKRGSNKKIQTSVIEALSKCVQTGDSLDVAAEKSKQSVESPVENQSVIIINYDSESDKKTCSSNTQTDAEVIASQCDSFEYCHGNVLKNDNLQRGSAKSVLVVSTDSSNEIPLLGQLISEKQSTSLTGDVNKSIAILQKLLKSKKYDSVTKKRYIKKIVEKIVDNKYKEDSTTSSELFIPKKSDERVAQQKLQENVPWYPPQISKFTVKTFSEEFLPGESQLGSKTKSISSLNEPRETPSTCLESGDTGGSLEKQQNVSSGSYQSWKEDKTLSERILEEKQRGQGDHLVKFAMKERQHQLAWIKDEISHLTKLKGLLEKKVQRTTTVYMVSQHLGKSRENSCSCSDSEQAPPRNYVIQTELSSSTSSEGPTRFNLQEKSGKKSYSVKELSRKPGDVQIDRRVVGDIQVVSDDNTTNIKVKTRKVDDNELAEFTPRPPTLIGVGKYDTFPKSKAEERGCPCGMTKFKGPRIGDLIATKPYSFELPIQDSGDLKDKVNEIINKYTKEPPPERTRTTCKCCRCYETTGTQRKETNGTQRKETNGSQRKESNGTQRKGINGTQRKEINEIQRKELSGTQRNETTQCDVYLDIAPAEAVPKCCKCKEVQTSETDLVRTDASERVCCYCGSQMAATRQPTENVASQSEECACSNKQIQACACNVDESVQSDFEASRSATQSTSTPSTSGTTTTTASESARSCLCCKRKNVMTKNLYALRNELSNQGYPLCRPCYRQNRRGMYTTNFFSNPAHVCACYTVVETKTLNEIKQTITDLKNLDSQFCTCVHAENPNDSQYCKYCKCKLRRTSQNKNGIAYTLTFENKTPNEQKKEPKKKQQLEEIKIKIPVTYKKRYKDKENKKTKDKQTHDTEETSTGGVPKSKVYSLQEYLSQNRPGFVQTADERRKTVNDSRAQREQMTDYNKMKFLRSCQAICENNAKRLFSSKEMKDITKRNYSRCPEVQKKIVDNHERQLKVANRLMADTFNQKLRENVLKGKRNLPLDAKVVNLK